MSERFWIWRATCPLLYSGDIVPYFREIQTFERNCIVTKRVYLNKRASLLVYLDVLQLM